MPLVIRLMPWHAAGAIEASSCDSHKLASITVRISSKGWCASADTYGCRLKNQTDGDGEGGSSQ
ncbi:hypothetical protein ACHAW5_003118 [Stephanodiscus triporus]|uniref:Secreted protein n=1 Tax=Stephanodiscus triporus TaxID=2934178 RepID=A0ABD3MEP4_9STRA